MLSTAVLVQLEACFSLILCGEIAPWSLSHLLERGRWPFDPGISQSLAIDWG